MANLLKKEKMVSLETRLTLLCLFWVCNLGALATHHILIYLALNTIEYTTLVIVELFSAAFCLAVAALLFYYGVFHPDRIANSWLHFKDMNMDDMHIEDMDSEDDEDVEDKNVELQSIMSDVRVEE